MKNASFIVGCAITGMLMGTQNAVADEKTKENSEEKNGCQAMTDEKEAKSQKKDKKDKKDKNGCGGENGCTSSKEEEKKK